MSRLRRLVIGIVATGLLYNSPAIAEPPAGFKNDKTEQSKGVDVPKEKQIEGFEPKIVGLDEVRRQLGNIDIPNAKDLLVPQSTDSYYVIKNVDKIVIVGANMVRGSIDQNKVKMWTIDDQNNISQELAATLIEAFDGNDRKFDVYKIVNYAFESKEIKFFAEALVQEENGKTSVEPIIDLAGGNTEKFKIYIDANSLILSLDVEKMRNFVDGFEINRNLLSDPQIKLLRQHVVEEMSNAALEQGEKIIRKIGRKAPTQDDITNVNRLFSIVKIYLKESGLENDKRVTDLKQDIAEAEKALKTSGTPIKVAEMTKKATEVKEVIDTAKKARLDTEFNSRIIGINSRISAIENNWNANEAEKISKDLGEIKKKIADDEPAKLARISLAERRLEKASRLGMTLPIGQVKVDEEEKATEEPPKTITLDKTKTDLEMEKRITPAIDYIKSGIDKSGFDVTGWFKIIDAAKALLEKNRGKCSIPVYDKIRKDLVDLEKQLDARKEREDTQKEAITKMSITKLNIDNFPAYITKNKFGLMSAMDKTVMIRKLIRPPEGDLTGKEAYRSVSVIFDEQNVNIFIRNSKDEVKAAKYVIPLADYKKLSEMEEKAISSALLEKLTGVSKQELTSLAALIYASKDSNLIQGKMLSFTVTVDKAGSATVIKTGEPYDLGVSAKTTIIAPLDSEKRFAALDSAGKEKAIAEVLANGKELDKTFKQSGLTFKYAQKEIDAIENAVTDYTKGNKEELAYLIYRYLMSTKGAQAEKHIVDLVVYLTYTLQKEAEKSGAKAETVIDFRNITTVFKGKKFKITSSEDILKIAGKDKLAIVRLLQQAENLFIAELSPSGATAKLKQVLENAKAIRYRTGGPMDKYMQKVRRGSVADEDLQVVEDGRLGPVTIASLFVYVAVSQEEKIDITPREPEEKVRSKRFAPEKIVPLSDLDIEHITSSVSRNDVSYKLDEVSWLTSNLGQNKNGSVNDYAKAKGLDVKNIIYEWIGYVKLPDGRVLIEYAHPNAKKENPTHAEVRDILTKRYYAVGDLETGGIYRLKGGPNYNPGIGGDAKIGEITEVAGKIIIDFNSIDKAEQDKIIFRTESNELKLRARATTTLEQGVSVRLTYKKE